MVFQLWAPNKPAVNRRNCSCSCFDTVLRGGYEYPPSGYKHVYWNATPNGFRMWLVMVSNIILIYKVVEHVFKVLVKASCVRRSFFMLLFVNIYPHYYSFWSYLNYYNEEVYDYFYHHFYFYVTEWLATFTVISLLDQRVPLSVAKLLFIVDVSVIHLFVSSADQLIAHVLYHQARGFINARDVSLAVCDLVHLAVVAFHLVRLLSSQTLVHSTNSTGSLSYPSRLIHSNQRTQSDQQGVLSALCTMGTRYEVLASFIFVLSSCVLLRLF